MMTSGAPGCDSKELSWQAAMRRPSLVSLAAERKKLPDQFGECALDFGAVVEEADADARRLGLRRVKPAPHDLARHGEVRDIAGSRRWNRGHGLLQQQA